VHLLEEEPESGNRWRRLGAGALISALALVVLGYGAQRFEPTRRLLQKVVQMTVVAELPKPEKLPPPRTEPPPPPPKRAQPPPKSAAKTAAPPKADTPQPPSSEPVVGLDGDSFGSGEGASFQVGNTQMGEPTNVARAAAGPLVAAAPAPPKLVPAGVPPRVERCRYSSRAQRLGLEGMMVIEVDIDEKGRVQKADVRKGLDEEIDRECLEAVRGARFEPATLGGGAVASTRFLRLRFELER
jgi:periplasmic protein TonB